MSVHLPEKYPKCEMLMEVILRATLHRMVTSTRSKVTHNNVDNVSKYGVNTPEDTVSVSNANANNNNGSATDINLVAEVLIPVGGHFVLRHKGSAS